MNGLMTKQNDEGLIWATVNLDAVAGSQSVTATLPGGASGRPKLLRASGAVGGSVSMNFGNNQQVTVLVNPNAPPDEKPIPAQASGVTQSISLTVFAAAAGYIFITVGFKPA